MHHLALVAIAAAVLAGLIIAARRRDSAGHTDTGRLDDILDGADSGPVEHHGATEEWTPRREFAVVLAGDPFTADLDGIDLDGALLFGEVQRRRGTQIDWLPESFTGWWSSLRVDTGVDMEPAA